MTEITEKEIDAIADEKFAMVVERMTQRGDFDKTKEVVDALFPGEKPSWHKCRGMLDVVKLDPNNKRRQISLVYPQRILAWVDAAVQCGVELNEEEMKYYELCKNITGVSLFVLEDGSICWVDNPVEHHIDEQGRLSNRKGPAILFEDGSKTYAIDDVFDVPAWVVETPAEKMKISDVLALENVDHRRVAIEKIGIERLTRKAKLIEKMDDGIGGEYKLYDLSHVFNGQVAKYLSMVNPSDRKLCVEGVDNRCNTVQEALDFRSGRQGWNPGEIDGKKRKKGNKAQKQQGDVCFELFSGEFPKEGPLRKRTLLSDANQKRHVISGGSLYGNDDAQYLTSSKKDVKVTHPEHGTITLNATKKRTYWKITPTKEIDHVTGILRAVID